MQAALVTCWRRWDRIARDGTVDGYVRASSSRPTPTGGGAAGPARCRPRSSPRCRRPQALVEERHDVLAALALLPRGQRAVVVLRFYDDLTEAQTADALGITVGTVKSQTARALKALRPSSLLQEDQS